MVNKELTDKVDKLTEDIKAIKTTMAILATEQHSIFDELIGIRECLDTLNDSALQAIKYYQKLMKFEQEMFWKNSKDQK